MPSIPNARELFDGDLSPSAQSERNGALRKNVKSDRDVRDERQEFLEEMTKATIAGLNGDTDFVRGTPDQVAQGYIPGRGPVMPIATNPTRREAVRKAMDDFEMAKSAGTANWGELEKEWTLTNPVSTGLVPFDLNFGVAA